MITKEKPAKFQIKWTTASKVMRQCNFCAPKGVSTPKGVQMCPTWHFLVFQVELPSNNEYKPNLKPNRWKLLHLWPTALSGTQNCPIPIGTFWGRITNLWPYHILDIITKEIPAKFHTKWTSASKVLRPRNFYAPKRVSTPKGAQIAPNWSILFVRCWYPEIMCTVQISSETVENYSIYHRPHFLGPKMSQFP